MGTQKASLSNVLPKSTLDRLAGHTHTRGNHSNDNNKKLFEALKLIRINIYCTYAKPLIIKHIL